MTQIRVVNPVQTDFTMLPNIVWRWPGLSFRAKAFLAYLLSFHGGVCPPVAAMEAETGLGRDARRACMAELKEARLADWVVERDRAGRVVSKWLEVTTLPLVAAQVQEAETRAAAVAAQRAAAAGNSPRRHAPEKPSNGFSGGSRRNFRRAGPASQAILKDEDEDRKSAQADGGNSVDPDRQAVSLSDLTPFAASCLAAGRPVPLGAGRSLPVGSPGYRALEREVLRQRQADHAMNRPGLDVSRFVPHHGARGGPVA